MERTQVATVPIPYGRLHLHLAIPLLFHEDDLPMSPADQIARHLIAGTVIIEQHLGVYLSRLNRVYHHERHRQRPAGEVVIFDLVA